MNKSSSATSGRLILSTDTTAQKAVRIKTSDRRVNYGRKYKKVENAVYSYIRALRTLGKLQVNTIEISEALSIPSEDVGRALLSLKKKGVKIRRGI